MLGRNPFVVAILTTAVLLSQTPPALAGAGTPDVDTEIHAVYQRLRPGMTIEEVASASDGVLLRTSAQPVTSWLLWNPPGSGHATAVLRATFREGRLARVEYEVFGEQYQRLVKGNDPEVDITESELKRLWRRNSQLERAAGDCQTTMEAYHRLVLSAQPRLTAEEQAAWVRALELRRAVESLLGSGAR